MQFLVPISHLDNNNSKRQLPDLLSNVNSTDTHSITAVLFIISTTEALGEVRQVCEVYLQSELNQGNLHNRLEL